VALGHNDQIAWGITIVGTDQADIYVEKTKPGDPASYLVGDRYEKMTIVREAIHVKGRGQPLEIELRYTRHGPVIHQDDQRGYAFALKWAGSEPGGAAYLGGLAVARARNRTEFLQALAHWKIPSLNFVYADRSGDIGWVAAGAIPVRSRGHDGLLPVPGWTGSQEWLGYLSVAEMPQEFNPARQWLATANHNILPKGYPRQIAYEWAPPHRYLRIEQRLNQSRRFTLDDFQSMQHDATTLPGLALARLLAAVPAQDASLTGFVKLLGSWDGVLARDSAAGALAAVWLQEISRSFDERAGLNKDATAALRSLTGISTYLAALEQANPVWFSSTAARDDFLTATFRKAVERTKKLLGDDPKTWKWGALHTAEFTHPLASLGPQYAKAFNLGPVARAGDGNTPHNTRHDERFRQVHGASYRQVFDLADWDQGRATNAPGQSGQPGSRHYDDLVPLWAEERYFPLAFSRVKVEEVAAHRLLLVPR
ncbi:MAG: penicillin acylase family protein, partial [Gemmataceae bacterium]|nr:penicillin acylase family protein [Gemmataceae bacterium]